MLPDQTPHVKGSPMGRRTNATLSATLSWIRYAVRQEHFVQEAELNKALSSIRIVIDPAFRGSSPRTRAATHHCQRD
jgi:hypothetical protein